jgi:DNA-binding transcriptional ArsR family regulator/predicted transcriptional regulator
MTAEPDIARVACTIGDPTRVRMLTLLMEGRALTAKELAHGTGIEPATASVHLGRLLADSLVHSRIQGRHKYFRLASADVARCIESLMAIALPEKPTVAMAPAAIHMARFCYDHLAGKLAVEITGALMAKKLVEDVEREFQVSKKGERWLEAFGIDLVQLGRTRRTFAPLCLDWSERKDHIGGALGAAMARRMLEEGWIDRKQNSRVVRVTPKGKLQFKSTFGIRWD